MARSNFIVRGGADFSGITRELNKTQKQLQGFKNSVSRTMKTIGTILGSLAVGKLIKDSTQMAMGVETAIENINHNMRSAAKAFQNWVETQSSAFGMAKADAYNYGSVFSNLLSSFTSSAEETAEKTQELMQAAAIIASRTGRTYEDVSNRIRSGLLGSTEAIEDLGVYTNISVLQATEAFKKFAGDKSWQQLDFRTQQQIRLAAILEQTYKRYGNTLADTTQTRQAQFIASLRNIQLSLGQAFLPIYNAVLPALTAMANAIGRVVSLIAQFTTALFGAPKQAQAQTTAIQSQAVAMEDLGAATAGAGKAAKKAAKEAQGTVASFDEVHNIITKQGSSGGGDIGGGAVSTVPMPELEMGGFAESAVAVTEKVKEFVEKFKEALTPVTAAFENVKAAAQPIIDNIGQGLRWFYDNILVPFASWTISQAIPTFLNMLAAALTALNPVIEAFKAVGQWLWSNFLQPLAKWTGDAFIAAMNGVANAFRRLGDWMSQNQDAVIAGIAGILSGLLAYKALTTIPSIITTIQKAFGLLSGAIGLLSSPIGIVAIGIGALTAAFVYFYRTNESFRGVVDGILNAIKNAAINLWQNALVPLGQFLGSVFVTAWNAVTTAVQWLWQTILVPFGNFLLWLWNSVFVPIGKILIDVLGVAFSTVAGIAQSFWQNVLVPLGSALAEMFVAAVEAVAAVLSFLWNNIWIPFSQFLFTVFKPIVEVLTQVWLFLWQSVLKPFTVFLSGVFVGVFDTVFRFIGDIIEGLKNIFVGLLNFITGVFTGNWQKAWEGVRKIFKGIFDSLWGIVKVPLNLIIDGINAVIDGLNSIKIDIPDWVPGIGGRSFGIHIPKIPKLAQGGIVTSPTLAMIGEQGPEVVMPLKNTGFVDAIASAVGSAVLGAMQVVMAQNTESSRELVLEINGRQFVRAILDDLDKELTRMGYRSIYQTV